jgi:predicted phage gp36 major capsid-like protein
VNKKKSSRERRGRLERRNETEIGEKNRKPTYPSFAFISRTQTQWANKAEKKKRGQHTEKEQKQTENEEERQRRKSRRREEETEERVHQATSRLHLQRVSSSLPCFCKFN